MGVYINVLIFWIIVDFNWNWFDSWNVYWLRCIVFFDKRDN